MGGGALNELKVRGGTNRMFGARGGVNKLDVQGGWVGGWDHRGGGGPLDVMRGRGDQRGGDPV